MSWIFSNPENLVAAEQRQYAVFLGANREGDVDQVSTALAAYRQASCIRAIADLVDHGKADWEVLNSLRCEDPYVFTIPEALHQYMASHEGRRREEVVLTLKQMAPGEPLSPVLGFRYRGRHVHFLCAHILRSSMTYTEIVAGGGNAEREQLMQRFLAPVSTTALGFELFRGVPVYDPGQTTVSQLVSNVKQFIGNPDWGILPEDYAAKLFGLATPDWMQALK